MKKYLLLIEGQNTANVSAHHFKIEGGSIWFYADEGEEDVVAYGHRFLFVSVERQAKE